MRVKRKLRVSVPYVKYINTSHHAYASAARGEARRLAPKCDFDFVATASSASQNIDTLQPPPLDAKPGHRGA